jgi:phosphotriesterase-related protein
MTRRAALTVLGAGVISQGKASGASPIIRTVLKDLPPESLSGGATLFHEHLSLAPDFMPKWIALARGQNTQSKTAPPSSPAQPSDRPFFMQDADLMTDELRAAAKEGVACIVDGGHPDMGRDLDFLKKISMQSGMPIVAGCGYYSQPFYPPEITSMTEDQITRELVRQARTQPVGAFGEIGSWDEITDLERKVFRAVGKAHLETNLPIFTHTGIPGKSAMEQLDILEEAGVKPQRVAIGHVGNLVDPKIEVHKALCKRGAFIGFDRQGGPGDARQTPMVVALIDAGYADNLLFSSDLSTANQLKQNGGTGYAKTVTVFAPKLSEAGVKEDMLHGILVDNPGVRSATMEHSSRSSRRRSLRAISGQSAPPRPLSPIRCEA